jgi:hypothetical protein
MPIYGYGLIGAPWTWDKNLSKSDHLYYIKTLKKALRNFEYAKDDIFRATIDFNIKGNDTSFIAYFNIHRSNIPYATYMRNMESLLNEANNSLKKDNIKFDIIGNWDVGKIIIMKRNDKKEKKK